MQSAHIGLLHDRQIAPARRSGWCSHLVLGPSPTGSDLPGPPTGSVLAGAGTREPPGVPPGGVAGGQPDHPGWGHPGLAGRGASGGGGGGDPSPGAPGGNGQAGWPGLWGGEGWGGGGWEARGLGTPVRRGSRPSIDRGLTELPGVGGHVPIGYHRFPMLPPEDADRSRPELEEVAVGRGPA